MSSFRVCMFLPHPPLKFYDTHSNTLSVDLGVPGLFDNAVSESVMLRILDHLSLMFRFFSVGAHFRKQTAGYRSIQCNCQSLVKRMKLLVTPKHNLAD